MKLKYSYVYKDHGVFVYEQSNFVLIRNFKNLKNDILKLR